MRRVRRSTACTWSWAVARPDKLSFGWEKLESLLREPNLRERIMTAETAQEVFTLVRDADAKVPG